MPAKTLCHFDSNLRHHRSTNRSHGRLSVASHVILRMCKHNRYKPLRHASVRQYHKYPTLVSSGREWCQRLKCKTCALPRDPPHVYTEHESTVADDSNDLSNTQKTTSNVNCTSSTRTCVENANMIRGYACPRPRTCTQTHNRKHCIHKGFQIRSRAQSVIPVQAGPHTSRWITKRWADANIDWQASCSGTDHDQGLRKCSP